MKFYSVRLLVRDYDSCFRFYTEKLGMKALWGAPGDVYATLALDGGGEIALFNSDLMADALGNSGLPIPQNSREKSMIVLEVEDVDRVYADLKNKGVEFHNTPHDRTDWGLRCVHLYDPEGNLIEMFSNLPTEQWCEELNRKREQYEGKD